MADNIEIWAERFDSQIGGESSLIIDSNSKGAAWRLWRDILSFCLRTIQKIWEQKISDYEIKRKARSLNDVDYYRSLSIAFQTGHTLQFLGDRFGYITINSDDQICNVAQITRIDISNQSGIRIHPGFKDGDGDIQVLSASELTEFTEYIEGLKPCGRRVTIYTSAVANFLIDMTVYYDPTKLNSDGSRIDDPTVFPILDAIEDYQDNWVNKNSAINGGQLRKRVAIAYGVVDLNYVKQQYDAAGGTSYTDVTVANYPITILAQYNKAGTPTITYTSI